MFSYALHFFILLSYMVGRITTGNNFEVIISYDLREEKGEILLTNIIGDSAESFAKQMELVAQLNTRVEKPVKHFIISFSKDDEKKMTNELMCSIVEEYLEVMGYVNNQFVSAAHTDTDTLHLHIACNRISFDGVVVKDSNERLKSREILNKLEKKYDLTVTSKAYESKFKEYDRNKNIYNEKQQNEKGIKKYVREQIRSGLKQSPYSFDQFESLLKTEGIEITIANNRKGISFRFNDVIYKGSELSKNYSYNGLSSTLRKNALDYFKKTIKNCLELEVTTIDDFFNELRKDGFEPRMNSAKNGWSLKKGGVEIKGSELNGMSYNNLINQIKQNSLKSNVRLIKTVVFNYLKNRGDDKNSFISSLKKKNIIGEERSEGWTFKYGQHEIQEGKLGGRVSQYGMTYLLLANKVDKLLDELMQNCRTKDELTYQLKQEKIDFVIGDEKFMYQLGGMLISGDSLYFNKDREIEEKLEKNRITTIVNQSLMKDHTLKEYIHSLNIEGVNVAIEKEKLVYKSNITQISSGRICDLNYINSKLSNSNNANTTKGIGNLGNPTTKNREEEDEEERKRNKNNDYGQTL